MLLLFNGSGDRQIHYIELKGKSNEGTSMCQLILVAAAMAHTSTHALPLLN
jgi:hypothetical protein